MGIAHRMRDVALLILLVVALTACGQTAKPVVAVSGGCEAGASPYLRQNLDVQGRITYCAQGDASLAILRTTPYGPGTEKIVLMVSGYPANAGISLQAVSLDGAVVAPIKTDNVGDSWKALNLSIPAPVTDRAFAIELVDKSSSGFGWAGIGQGPTISALSMLTHMAPLLGTIVIAHCWLILLALSLPCRWSTSSKVTGAMLAMGMASAITVAAYVLRADVGTVISGALLAAPVLFFTATRRYGSELLKDLLATNRLLAAPLMLCLLVLWIGLYPFDWDGSDGAVPAARWRDLPVDAWLPYIFAEMIGRGHITNPMFGDWLSSDRPPLQSGLYLIFRHVWPDRSGLVYQAVATWAQALVLVPVYLLLISSVAARPRAVILFTIATSSLVILNSLFVWPKLLAATYCAIYHIALFKHPSDQRGSHWLTAGIAAALAMLCHGGALFVLVGSTAAFLIQRRLPHALPSLVKCGAVAVLLYLPWVLYQRLIDPPGDRLLKWHFAGQIEVSNSTLFQALGAAYSNRSFGGWILDRVGNVRLMTAHTTEFFADVWSLLANPGPSEIKTVVERSFFFTSYSMWFASPLLLVPILIYLRLRRQGGAPPLPWPPGVVASLGLSLLFWVSVMLLPESTIIHSGAYLGIIFLQMTTLLSLAWCSPPLLYIAVAANTVIFAYIYAFDRPFDSVVHFPIYATSTSALILLLLVACLKAGSQDLVSSPNQPKNP